MAHGASFISATLFLGVMCASAQQTARAERLFQRLDGRNGDGTITRDEAPGDAAFTRADADGDGRVTREELTRRAGRSDGTRSTETLDRPLPERVSHVETDFQLAYIHKGRVAQASVVLDAFEQGSQDLLIASKRWVHLVRNRTGRFTHAVGNWVHGNTKSHWNVYAVVPIDYDRDGDVDLFVAAVVRGGTRRRPAEGTRSVAFLENVSEPGRIRFVDRTEEAGFGRFNALPAGERAHISFASGAPVDVDNDGWVDLCLVNRRDNDKTPWPWPHLFRNTGQGRFVEVDHETHGIGGGGGGRDLNYGDFDADGRLDLVIHDGTVGGYDGADNSRVYVNRIENANHWLKIRVQGPSNRYGIGSKVTVFRAGTHDILGRDEVRTDFCYRSKRSPILHFGLGTATTVDVAIQPRNGSARLLQGLEADRMHTWEIPE